MTTRRFEFSEGGSQKFWEVTVSGNSFTVRFGRLGTDGQSKTTTCGSADEAMAEAAKLIREKTKKGYQEIGAAAAEKSLRRPPHYENFEHSDHFLNYAVVDVDPDEGPLKDVERRAFAIRTDYDGGEEQFTERLDALLNDPKVGQVKALVIGQWFGDDSSTSSGAVIEKLIAAKSKLASLEGLFLGDIVSEESEISWITQGDVAPLIMAFPKLQEFVVRGGNGLRFKGLKHANLKTLIVQTGGLSRETVQDLATSDLPALERAVLWLGSDNYGGNTTVADLQPILQGSVWPKLEYLGLADSEIADAIAEALKGAPILSRIRGLDLSMGNLGDAGGLALLGNPAIKQLKFLNLRYHYLSEEVAAQLKKLGIEVDLSDPQEGEEDERYIEVSE